MSVTATYSAAKMALSGTTSSIVAWQLRQDNAGLAGCVPMRSPSGRQGWIELAPGAFEMAAAKRRRELEMLLDDLPKPMKQRRIDEIAAAQRRIDEVAAAQRCIDEVAAAAQDLIDEIDLTGSLEADLYCTASASCDLCTVDQSMIGCTASRSLGAVVGGA